MGTSVQSRRPSTTTTATNSSSGGSYSTPLAMAHADDAMDDAAVLGVAIDTRNYRALLAQTSPSPAGDTSVSSASSAGDGYNDNTVVGVALDTRNYMALLQGHQQTNNQAPPPVHHHGRNRRGSDSPVAMGIAVNAGNIVRPGRASSNPRDTETINEDEDAVLGLPIDTRNYLAMRQSREARAPSRQRSRSGPAGPSSERPSLGGRRSTPNYGIAAQSSTSGSTAGRSTDSCFDARRTAGAIVPHKGWLYIQSKTMKSWKRYFAVLSGLDFRYSPEPGRASKGFGLVQSVERWDGKPWGIRVVYTSGTQVHAYCVSEQEREEWIDHVTKGLERLQNVSGHSKTTYTLAADQHEGYLFKQDRSKKWVLNFFTLRNDGYMQCREDAGSPADPKCSGYVRSVTMADVHANALAIELVSGESVFVYTETYDDHMLWYAAITALANANSKVPHSARLVKSSYIQTALPNHSGWLYKQTGLFKSWKRVYCTLHGLEFGYAKDVNSSVEDCGKINGVKEWDGKQHGLEIRFASGTTWKLHAESYETAKHWRTVIADVCRHVDRFNIKSYLNSRRKKKLRPVFGGWLTTHKGSSHVRRFYVADGNMLGVADDVDNLLQPIGSVVDIGATRDTTNGMLMVFADGSRLKVSGDSVESSRAWYDCISSSL